MKKLPALVLTALGPILAVSGCQSSVPLEIREPPATGSPTLAQVQQSAVQQFTGAPVRWGGKIVKVENKPQDTWLEVIERRLDGDGRPEDEDVSLGRFLIQSKQFLDPAIYKVDRLVTVSGSIDGVVEKPIDERPYRYPIVKSQRVYLWENRPAYRYDPWYPGRSYYFDPYFGYPMGPRYWYGRGRFWW